MSDHPTGGTIFATIELCRTDGRRPDDPPGGQTCNGHALYVRETRLDGPGQWRRLGGMHRSAFRALGAMLGALEYDPGPGGGDDGDR